MFVFEQCLLCFAYHPDVWYDAASYLENTGRDLIERGVKSILLFKNSFIKFSFLIFCFIVHVLFFPICTPIDLEQLFIKF